jgi:Vacuolar-sorting-associated 13 protein C-terminal
MQCAQRVNNCWCSDVQAYHSMVCVVYYNTFRHVARMFMNYGLNANEISCVLVPSQCYSLLQGVQDFVSEPLLGLVRSVEVCRKLTYSSYSVSTSLHSKALHCLHSYCFTLHFSANSVHCFTSLQAVRCSSDVNVRVAMTQALLLLLHAQYTRIIHDILQEMRPEELFVGMARGGGSLLKHTVGGVAHSFSQITGTFSKNLSTLSMDRDYKVLMQLTNKCLLAKL